uniref:Uncharacterized protein n=1 Tax=Anguilla anguilla TaxID=7936 RepID=A0A0E9RQF6_ANGAN
MRNNHRRHSSWNNIYISIEFNMEIIVFFLFPLLQTIYTSQYNK